MLARLLGMFGPREANGMRQHNPNDLYALGIIHRLLELKAGHQIKEYSPILTQVLFILEQFVNKKGNAELLPNTVEAAEQLKMYLEIFKDHAPDWPIDADTLEYLIKRGLVDHFESSLAIDLKALPLFLIEDKRGYSSRAFMRDASVVLSEKDREALSDLTLDDLAEAGRCLLLDRHTAAGFHIMRALEAVARGYYRAIFDADPINPNNKLPLGLGTLADHLRKYKTKLDSTGQSSGALPDIIPTLDRITSIYRNHIMHPEMTLDEDLAVEVFDNAKTAIAAMLRDIRARGTHFKSDLTALQRF